MRKNQQGGNPRSCAASNHQLKEAGGLTQQAATATQSNLMGFGQAAANQQQNHIAASTALIQSLTSVSSSSAAADHLTPHHGSRLGTSQSLATMGLPSPMGLGAVGTAPLPVTKSTSGLNQMAFAQIVSNQDKAGQLTAKQIDQIGKDLEQCATQGDADGMQEILASHHDVIPKKTLNVALRAAVKGCTTPKLDYSIQCTELLIEAGANINSEEANEGKTALMMSCEKGYLELVKNLLDHEALIDHKDQKKRTPLMYAIGTNAQNFDVVQELLNRGADVNEQTLTGLTPLLLATKKEHTRICKLLLSRGADIAAQFPEDLNSCLHYACIQGNIMALNTLLNHSRHKLTDQLTQEFLYLLNKNSKTALQIADELHSANPENNAHGQIFSEMSILYQQKEKAVDDLVETLLKKEDSTLQHDVSKDNKDQISSQATNSNQVAGGNKRGGRHQSKAMKMQAVAASAVDAPQSTTSEFRQEHEDQQELEDEVVNVGIDENTNTFAPPADNSDYQNARSVSKATAALPKSPDLEQQKQQQVQINVKLETAAAQTSSQSTTKSGVNKFGKQSKKAKKSANKSQQNQNHQALLKDQVNFAEVFQAAVKGHQQQQAPHNEPLTDEDEYKSAESKTPPSQKAVDQTYVMSMMSHFGGTKSTQPTKITVHNVEHQDSAENDDTVTEHSSDEDHFVDTRTSSTPTGAPAATALSNTTMSVTQNSATSAKTQPQATSITAAQTPISYSNKFNKTQRRLKKQQEQSQVQQTTSSSAGSTTTSFSKQQATSQQSQSQALTLGKKQHQTCSQKQNNQNANNNLQQQQRLQQAQKHQRDIGKDSSKSSSEKAQKVTTTQQQQDTSSSLPPWMQTPPQSSSSHQKANQANTNAAATTSNNGSSQIHHSSGASSMSSSQGAVQKPIIQQPPQNQSNATAASTTSTSWPQVLIQKLAAASNNTANDTITQQSITNNNKNSSLNNSNNRSSSSPTSNLKQQKQQQHQSSTNSNNRKQNAAVVENLKPPVAVVSSSSSSQGKRNNNRIAVVNNKNCQEELEEDQSKASQPQNKNNNNLEEIEMDSNSQQSEQTSNAQTSPSQQKQPQNNIEEQNQNSTTGGVASYQDEHAASANNMMQHYAGASQQQLSANNHLQSSMMTFNNNSNGEQTFYNNNRVQIGATPGSAPITLFKNLDTRKAQFDFILEQQEMRNKMLTFQLYSHKERMREIELDVKQRKQDHIMRVNEYYNQANRYYENFRQLETEMNTIADKNDQTLQGSMNLLGQLREKVKGHQNPETQNLIQQIEQNLHKMEATNQKFNDEMDFRKEDEKSYIQSQTDQRQHQNKILEEQTNLQQDMAMMKDTCANKQVVAKTQIQYNNLFIEMENAFGEETEQSLYQQSSRYPQQVFNKLHDEVILFDESVKSIMDEIEPVKMIIIDKISAFIKLLIPNGDVEVYGSHATKLCLHWSDIDLVLKPSHGGYTSNVTNMRNWLSLIYNELIKSENRGWLQKVDFIENTTVPVIKLACSFHHLSQNANGQLLLPNGQVPRYPAIVSKPINVDITLWSENHNGLPCVKLVKSYLQESQLIEPLILVLKQMLKVWGFNDAYTGGLSSYALFLMIVSFLQEKRKPALKSEVNMGETLLEFIRYYAQLDFSQYAICCKMPGEQSDKQNLYLNTNSEYNFFLQPRIVIDDPLMASNNVGKSAFRFQEIKNIMSHAYNSVFTGCFCSCHYKSMCRNTNFHQNPHTYHKSQLLSSFSNSGQSLPQAPTSYLSFQHPPVSTSYKSAKNNNSQLQQQMPVNMGGSSQMLASLILPESSNSSTLIANNNEFMSNSGNDPQSQVAATPSSSSQNNRAPYPAGMAPQLRTQSQPFQIGGGRGDSQLNNAASWQSQNQIFNQNINTSQQQYDAEVQCSCDSILSRLIYGYNNYRRTMESLHPNLGPIQMGQNSYNNNQAPGIATGGFGLAGLSGLPFIGGQNL